MPIESDLIRRYRGAFSPDDCKKIIKDINFFEENNFLAYNKEGLHKEDHKTINVCWDYDYDLPVTSRIASSIIPKFKPCVDEYIQTFSVLLKSKFLIYDCKLKKIPIGGGFHNWHYENGIIGSTPRQFVIQLYLNDDFQGGETEFLYQNRREEATAGDVLIFPAGFTHTHRGNPPLGGEKYIATSWGIVQANDTDY